MPFDCSWEEFKLRAKEFNDMAPKLDQNELDSAFKALGLSYFGMREEKWLNSAAMVMQMANKTYVNLVCGVRA